MRQEGGPAVPLAYFDADGVCVAVSTSALRKPNNGAKAQAPAGVPVARLWFDGEAVREAGPVSLAIPASVATGEAFVLDLPAGVVAEVEGRRQRGTLTIDTASPGRVMIDIRGAQSGEFVVEVRDYAAQRRAEYPSLADQLDALWKGGEDLAAMRDTIMAIKAGNPKAE